MSRRVYIALVVALGVTILVAGTALIVVLRDRGRPSPAALLRPTGIPAAVTTLEANLMALSPVPTRPATPFTLVDQNGRTVSLAQFRGHPIVLNFMDPHCTDICPLVSQELRDAAADLPARARSTVFLAIDVNPYVRTPAGLDTFSRAHGLTHIATWHFLAGPLSTLRALWHAYGIQVIAHGPTADVVHTSLTYFIGPRGHLRYVAAPQVDHTAAGVAFLPPSQLRNWGAGIAAVAASLVR